MHFKRRRHPNARAGCAMCKPQKKGNGMNPDKELGHGGFGKIRDLIHTEEELKEYSAMERAIIRAKGELAGFDASVEIFKRLKEDE